MGWISNFKAKRVAKKALTAYHQAHALWIEDVAIFDKITKAFTLASKGQDAFTNFLVAKADEIVIWQGQGQLHEAGSTPGHYEGGSSGFSIPLFAGIRYRVSAMRGTFVAGDPTQVYKEQGEVLITTARLVFNGGYNTKEWSFAKWTGASTSVDESDYIFHVSNRQKTSGIAFDPLTGREFNRFLAQALNCAEKGINAVVKELVTVIKELHEDEPKPPALEPPVKMKAIEG